ncbi:TPA: IS3 family transposase [Enterococcus faecalis]|nr:IS3 family transposase [Enterococcus faecalis]
MSEKTGALAIATALRETIDRTSDCPYRRTFHSDQGWIYQRPLYTGTLKKHGIFQSMSRKGNCLDNSPMENFFGIMKQEMFYDTQFHSFQELSTAITDYIFYYNNTRIKELLGGLSPAKFRQKNYRKIA